MMKKISLEILEKRASSVISLELLGSISGGTENSCHDDEKPKPKGPDGNGRPNVIIDS
ncbi:hypothetical protein [Tenacibaculum sp. E3R01]|uniref:hypothetical protein n=1 Tax=Tenacibaculum sp. E3R01 TaxID=2267227 RepID=UPI0013140042|nr:hypothetical protein [Tenacibaculum sp. E3R01]